jgi:GNAT superfamily N-acetyltransferase
VVRSFRYGRADDKFFSPSYEDPTEQWTVLELVVSPKCQRNGVGMRLLEWGMAHARREQVPITLTSTTAGRRLYDKAGFYPYGIWRWAKGNDRMCTLMRFDRLDIDP